MVRIADAGRSCGQGGLGHALSTHFVKNGFTVISTLLAHEERDHLKDVRIHVLDLDVTKEEQMLPFKKAVEAITGGLLDVLVNNAYDSPHLGTGNLHGRLICKQGNL